MLKMLQFAEDVLDKFKVKPMTNDQILLAIDRLTRFKFTEDKYLRVFKDVITSNLLYPKFKKQDLDELSYSDITKLASCIFNYTLGDPASLFINQRLAEYEKSLFYIDNNIEVLLNNTINYEAALPLIDDNAPLNLKWLKSLKTAANASKTRFLHALRYPLTKIVICEGITEEILLPEFSKMLGYDFDKNGVYILSAGGKNQVVKLFYKLADIIKLPIFVLLDKDAQINSEQIEPKLRQSDKIYLLQSGEFEDILPIELLEKTLKYATENISNSTFNEIESGHTVEFLEDFFKHRGLHEFKKSEFATMVKENLSVNIDLSDEIKKVINSISAL